MGLRHCGTFFVVVASGVEAEPVKEVEAFDSEFAVDFAERPRS